jgi:copper homeostasis protein
MKLKLEICCDSVESAINAQIAGAHRVELCADLGEGGITPGYGTISTVRNNISIGLHVIIRPRGGDFLYSSSEYEIMKRDIVICEELGINGVVLGILKKDGSVDVARTANLVDLAYPMNVTFHRAFDMCNDPFNSLEDVVVTGASRILTSGQKNQAGEGIDLLNQLVKMANGRIIIMAGGGINNSNVEHIIRSTNVTEIHMSGRKTIQSEMEYRKNNVSMTGNQNMSEFIRKVADIEKIREVIKIMKQFQ